MLEHLENNLFRGLLGSSNEFGGFLFYFTLCLGYGPHLIPLPILYRFVGDILRFLHGGTDNSLCLRFTLPLPYLFSLVDDLFSLPLCFLSYLANLLFVLCFSLASANILLLSSSPDCFALAIVLADSSLALLIMRSTYRCFASAAISFDSSMIAVNSPSAFRFASSMTCAAR